jgi:biopolymer transport protein ExbD
VIALNNTMVLTPMLYVVLIILTVVWINMNFHLPLMVFFARKVRLPTSQTSFNPFSNEPQILTCFSVQSINIRKRKQHSYQIFFKDIDENLYQNDRYVAIDCSKRLSIKIY